MNGQTRGMPEGLSQAVGADNREKHIQLAGAISSLKSTVAHAQSLLSRINGPTPENKGAMPEDNPDPTLYDLLTGGADVVRDTEQQLHDLLDEIERSLF